ncbi:hypothetical protein ACXIVC_21745 [Vibrio parahaemolyticus]
MAFDNERILAILSLNANKAKKELLAAKLSSEQGQTLNIDNYLGVGFVDFARVVALLAEIDPNNADDVERLKQEAKKLVECD